MSSAISHLSCPRCGATHDARSLHGVCECGSPLLVEYDLERVGATPAQIAARAPTMWRYRELLPVQDARAVVSLGEGFTPLIPLPGGVLVKDDGLNPTGSFKARGAAAGVSRARELGARVAALPTAGNAGGAWACYGAAAGLEVHVAMPSDAPAANREECRLYGASVTLVDGLISDAAALVARWVAEHGWFDASTLREPYRIEGKKTLALEIAEQMGWRLPDVIVYPCGGGVGLIGIARAVEQMRALGWVADPPPRLIAVQARGCAPIVRAFESGAQQCEPWEGAATIGAGIRVPKPLGDFLILRALRDTRGTAVAVSDREMIAAMADLGRMGIAAAPEGAATYAALPALRARGAIRAGETVVLINTGSAYKYPDLLERAAEGSDEGRSRPGSE